MATANSTAHHNEFFEYREVIWGDLIYGTKELLQKIGLGVGMIFPGEVDGPPRRLNTIDPRGFRCTIEQCWYKGDGVFSASIRFPGRNRPYWLIDWEHFAPGVQRRAMCRHDEFKGTEEDLVAAGLVPAGYFPGLPGMRKMRVTILPDGSLPKGAPTANLNCNERGAGTKCIERISGTKYRVEIDISDELGDKRHEAMKRSDAEWAARMEALPRPPRIDGSLRAALNQDAASRRSALRLVWSRPKFVPGFNTLPLGPFAR